jgi:hypothetical protein
MTTPAEITALAHPALSRVLELVRRGGWQWFPAESRDGGPMLRGVRTWPGTDVADAIVIVSETNAHANRTIEEGATWMRSGTVADVVDGLLELPDPQAPLAPRRVLGVRVPGNSDV